MTPLMVLVFAPIGNSECGSSGSIPYETYKLTDLKSEVVGILTAQVQNIEDHGRLRAEVEAHGCVLDLVYRTSSDTPGYIAPNTAHRVIAPTLTKARDLPGFQPLYAHSKEHYVAHIIFAQNPGAPIHDNNVTQEFAMPPDAPLPKYDEDGIHTECLIPQGHLSCLVFFKERPESWFMVQGLASSPEAAIAAARSLIG